MEANLIDAHVHTRFSHDGISDMEEYMLAARGAGCMRNNLHGALGRLHGHEK